MEDEQPRPTIIQKTPEQLRQQVASVDFFNAIDRNPPILSTIKSELFTDPRAQIEGLKGGEKEFMRRQYREYVNVLRELRETQRTNLSQVIASKSENLSGALIEAVQWDQDLANIFIDTMQVSIRNNDLKKKLFGDENRVGNARQSRESLIEFTRGIMQDVPSVVYSDIRVMKSLLSDAEIGDAIKRAGASEEFLTHYSKASKYLNKGEKSRYITEAAKLHPGHEVIRILHWEGETLFTRDQIRELLIPSFNESLTFSQESLIKFATNNVLSLEEVEDIICKRAQEFKTLNNLSEVLKGIPGIDRQKIKDVIYTSIYERGTAFSLRQLLWEKESILTREEQREVALAVGQRDIQILGEVELLAKLFDKEELKQLVFDVLDQVGEEYDDSIGFREVIQSKVFTIDEKKEFVEKLNQHNLGDIALACIKPIVDLYPSEEQKAIAKNIADNATSNGRMQSIDEWSNFFTKDEIREYIETALLDPQAIMRWTAVYKIEEWSKHLTSDEVYTILTQYQPLIATEVLSCMDLVVPRIPVDKRQGFIRGVISSNPAVAIEELSYRENPNLYTNLGLSIDDEGIIQIALSDADTLAYAPKRLKDMLSQYKVGVSAKEQKTLLWNLVSAYENIGFIKMYGLEEQFRELAQRGDIPRSQELELLETFRCFAMLKSKDQEAFTAIDPINESFDKTKQILFGTLADRLHVRSSLSAEQIGRFFSVMDSPVPFTSYLLQHETSPLHNQLLGEMFQAICNGRWNEWKFGANTEEAFSLLREMQLLPKGLTFEQYQIWRSDEQTNLVDTLSSNVGSVAQNIRTYLEDNIEHLGITEIIDQLQTAQGQDIGVALQGKLGEVGQQLAALNKELSDARKLLQDERIEALMQQKDALEKQRRSLLRVRKISRLMNLSAEEVIAKRFLEGADKKRDGEQLIRTIDELAQDTDAADQFVFNYIRELLSSLSFEGVKQDLVCSDSSDPKVTLEIGAKPVSSCQHYANGSHNECLLGYNDPNTKILILTDNNGEVISRSVFRILSNEKDEAALHVERIYSKIASPAIDRSILTHAHKKAQAMQLPLYMSKRAQTEEGVEVELSVAEGFDAQATDTKLLSFRSRSPKVYVDSAGGERKNGEYELENLLEITKIAA